MVRCADNVRTDHDRLSCPVPPLLFPYQMGNVQMQIDFKALEQALAPIEQIGQGELTFDAGPATLTLRVLVPAEELIVQRHAAVAFAGSSDPKETSEQGDDANSAVEYLDKFRTATLSFAIVQVDRLDFHDVEYVETGEVIEGTEVPVKIAKNKAMRTLIERWARPVLVRTFRKYGELLQKVEDDAEKAIEFEPADHDAEMERLQQKLDELAEAKSKEDAANQEAFSAKVKAAAAQLEDAPEEPVAEQPEFEPEQALPISKRTGPITPPQAPPPAARAQRAPQPGSAQAPLHRSEPPPAEESLINTSDDDSMHAAVDAEHNRLLAMRRRSAAGEAQPHEGSLLAANQGSRRLVRRPPHADAADADAALGTLDAGAAPAGAQTVFPDGPEELGTRSAAAPTPVLNPEQGGTANPRFKPRQKP